MPDSMSIERRLLMTAYGAELVLTEGKKGMAGAVERAEELKASIPGALILGQFENPANPAAHRVTTGFPRARRAPLRRACFHPRYFGTISGVGQYLKSRKNSVRIVAVEPKSSPLLSEGHAGPHGLQGIGANFIPKALDRSIYDEIITVSDEEAYAAGRALAAHEGILAGISSGAALHAATELAKRPENAGKCIVALLPDTGERYLSSPMFKENDL